MTLTAIPINCTLKRKGREIRVGSCHITFHCTPKSHAKARAERRRGEGDDRDSRKDAKAQRR